MWAFPEKDEDVTVVQGEGTLKEYEFGNKTRSHKVRLIALAIG